ncbi:uncharacterized protein LOC135205624 [Macrobrachium nipponense]|uniref:uncharacterized protein LOC135205624 n=1 Tax=Macrobrachium nipponense TaxID=159736 RepID=UPI0030C886C5
MAPDDPAKNIKFVQEIEKYSCIYNHTLQEYSSKEATENAWQKVAKEMEDTVPNCKEKWRNLRTVFVRKMKQPPGRGPSGRKNAKPYYLMSAMQFIIPYVKTQLPNVSGNYISKEEEEEEEAEKEDAFRSESEDELLGGHVPEDLEVLDGVGHQRGKKLLPSVNADEDNVPQDADALPTSVDGAAAEVGGGLRPKPQFRRKRRFPTWGNIDQSYTDFVSRKMSRMYADEDPRRQFLLSLLPDVHEMTDAQMRKFKKSVMEVVDTILSEPGNNTHGETTCSAAHAHVVVKSPSQ